MSLEQFQKDGSYVGTLTGFDPEIFVVNGENKLIPAFAFLRSKHEPEFYQPSQLSYDGYGTTYTDPDVRPAFYWDGFQAEFSTRPYKCHGWALDQIHTGLRHIRKAARLYDKTAKLTLQNVFEFQPEDLFKYPPQCIELGCDPSLNAYHRDPFQPGNPFEVPIRMAGGHIHFAYEGLELEEAEQLAKYMDWLVGIPTVGMFASIDNPARRNYYGRAGEFRLPKYGIEYRTLSNAWLGHPAVSNLIVDTARWALGRGKFRNYISPKDFGLDFKDIQAVIDNTDVNGAREIFQRSSELWYTITWKTYHYERTNQFYAPFEKMVMEGVESMFPDYRNIETNWFLDQKINHSHPVGDRNYDSPHDWVSFCKGFCKK